MARRQKGELIYGIGHVDYSLPITENGKKTKEYEAWRSMLKRCFDDGYLEREPTYNGCIVSEEWAYYKNFYNWITSQENYKQWKEGGNTWAIDKDILFKGNQLYSSETCMIVPQNVNNLFTTRKLHRGKYPIGVRYVQKLDKFVAYCNNPFKEKKWQHIGVFNTVNDAFEAYKKFKENIVKDVAECEFRQGNITEKCYNAMLNYKFEIND